MYLGKVNKIQLSKGVLYMQKRVLSIILILAMLCGIISGCTPPNNSETQTDPTVQTNPTDPVDPTEPGGDEPDVLDKMEAHFAHFLASEMDDPGSEFLIPTFIAHVLDQGVKVHVVPINGHWFGMTYSADAPMDREALKQMTGEGLYPTPLF